MLPQHRDEAVPEVIVNTKFDIAKLPVFAGDAKAALADIAETYYICTPLIYDLPGQLVKPQMYFQRFCSATVIIKLAFSFYEWAQEHILR